MCGREERVLFKVLGVVRADAGLRQQEPVQTGRNYWERSGQEFLPRLGGWEGGYGTKNSRSPYKPKGITGRGADRSSFKG